MGEPLVIVGAGGHGRETAFAFLLGAPEDRFLGFLDDGAAGPTPEGWPVLGPLTDAARHRHARFVVAVNDPRCRRAIVERMARQGIDRWGQVVHPEVRLHRTARLGAGSTVLGGVQATVNIGIGDHCILNRSCQVGHDCTIGAFCSLNPAACVAGNVRVGAGCELGSACSVRQGIRVGNGCTVGMGAVVVDDVADGAVVVGNPARVLQSPPTWNS